MTPNFNIPDLPRGLATKATDLSAPPVAGGLGFAEELHGEEHRQNFLNKENNAYSENHNGSSQEASKITIKEDEEQHLTEAKSSEKSIGTISAMSNDMLENFQNPQELLQEENPLSPTGETKVSLPCGGVSNDSNGHIQDEGDAVADLSRTISTSDLEKEDPAREGVVEQSIRSSQETDLLIQTLEGEPVQVGLKSLNVTPEEDSLEEGLVEEDVPLLADDLRADSANAISRAEQISARTVKSPVTDLEQENEQLTSKQIHSINDEPGMNRMLNVNLVADQSSQSPSKVSHQLPVVDKNTAVPNNLSQVSSNAAVSKVSGELTQHLAQSAPNHSAENIQGQDASTSQKSTRGIPNSSSVSSDVNRQPGQGVSITNSSVSNQSEQASARASISTNVSAQEVERSNTGSASQSGLANASARETASTQNTLVGQGNGPLLAEPRKASIKSNSRSRKVEGKPAILSDDSKGTPAGRGTPLASAVVSSRSALTTAGQNAGKGSVMPEATGDSEKSGSQQDSASTFKSQNSSGAQRTESNSVNRPVQVHSVFSRITNGVDQMKQEQLSTLQLRLSLGKGESVRIHLRLRGQSLRTVIFTDSDALRSAFRDGWDNFSRALSDKGVQPDGLEFSMSDQERGNSSAHSEWEERQIQNQEFAQMAALRSAVSAETEPSNSDSGNLDTPAETQQRFTRFA